MKKYLLIVLVAFSFPAVSLACGWSEPTYLDFYTLFIGGDRQGDCHCGTSGNIDEWKTFFDGRYNTNIHKIVYDYSVEDIQALLINEPNPLYVEAFNYLVYAKILGLSSKRVSGNVDPYSWDYEEILQQEVFDESLAAEGIWEFDQTTNIELKMRYAFQVIRYLHYNAKWSEAIAFFESHVPQLNLKNEIYYYCLDQVSGCYYSEGEYATSAYGFMQVIQHSRDRKQSATNSFNIQNEWDFESLLAKCQSPDERILARTLLTPFHYDLEDAKWILDNQFDEEALLGIYYYDDVYEEGMYNWMMGEDGEYYAGVDRAGFEEDSEVVKRIIQNPETKHLDFWYSCLAYFSFRNDRFGEARDYINQVGSCTMVDQERFEFFKSMYNILAQGTLSDDIENQLYDVLENQVQKSPNSHLFTDLFYTMLRSYYTVDGAIIKARLVTHTKDDIDQYYDFTELEDLHDLYLKKNKNKMEKFLLANALGKVPDINDYIVEKKASLLLMHNNYAQAKELFDQLPKNYRTTLTPNYNPNSPSYQFDGYTNVPKKVFSINIREGMEYNMDDILDDEVCFDDQFDFIRDTFTKAELNDYLIRLNAMAANENPKANYLLGNYYYNVSELGYFRNLLIYYPENNLCSYCKTVGILQDYWYKSNEYYSQVLRFAQDTELKAKTTYLMAKNVAFNDEEYVSYYYADHDATRSKECVELFIQLETTYGNTQFYDEIISECSVFSYYVAR